MSVINLTKAFINNRFNRWLKKRMPAQVAITLSRQNIFIFPSKRGLHFLITCCILFLLGTNYQNNLILFLVFFLCSFMLTCLLLSFQNMAGLTLTAQKTAAQYAGKDCHFLLRLSTNKEKPKDMTVFFKTAPSRLASFIDEQQVVLYSLSEQRGVYSPGRVTLRSCFPFGLYTVWTHLDFGLSCLIYPKPLENKLMWRELSNKQSANSQKNAIKGVDQFSSLKSYLPGESLKSVAWKQVAQGKGWFSKQFEQLSGADICLDINTLKHLPLERRLSYLCYQIIALEKNNQHYALSLGAQNIELGGGEQHKNRCLTALALYS